MGVVNRPEVIAVLKQHASEIDTKDFSFLNDVDTLALAMLESCVAILYEELGVTDIFDYISENGEFVKKKCKYHGLSTLVKATSELSNPVRIENAAIVMSRDEGSLSIFSGSNLIVDNLYVFDIRHFYLRLYIQPNAKFKVKNIISSVQLRIESQSDFHIDSVRCSEIMILADESKTVTIDNIISSKNNTLIAINTKNVSIGNIIAPNSIVQIKISTDYAMPQINNIIAKNVDYKNVNTWSGLRIFKADISNLGVAGYNLDITCTEKLNHIIINQMGHIIQDAEEQTFFTLRLPSSLKQKDIDVYAENTHNFSISDFILKLRRAIIWV